MKYIKVSIKTTTAAEDLVSSMLSDLGVLGVEIENNVPLTKEELSGMFIDFPPETKEDDGSSTVSFYMEEEICTEDFLRQVKDGLAELSEFAELGSGTVTLTETEDQDWLNNWKEFFHTFTIDDIVIKPTWEELSAADADKTLITIDPGISFGTGKHETTQLCIRLLRKFLKNGDRVLDVGCGSGILSIAALKLGASHVTGTDIDENCLASTRENFAQNELAMDMGDFYCGNLIEDAALRERVGKHCFDIAVANILAEVIIPLSPVMPEHLKPGGIFLVSGIIDFKEAEVKEALLSAGFTILNTEHMGEWVAFAAQKN